MRIKHRPADFEVEEMLALTPADHGPQTLYRVRKQDRTTLQVQTELAKALGVGRAAVHFPGIKDRRSVAVQYASVTGSFSERVAGRNWIAEVAGRLDRPLQPSDIAANRFRLVLRDLSVGEAAAIAGRLREMSEHGLPNYYDRQRFGSYHPQDGLLGRHIIRRDAQAALHAYLAISYSGEPAEIRAFKTVAAAHWGDWQALFDAAPSPSNYRSVLTFLRDHPDGWRKALNLLPRPLLSLYLEAYQSTLWNQIAAGYLRRVTGEAPADWRFYEVAGVELPVYRRLPAKVHARLAGRSIVLPHHRAAYTDPDLAQAVEAVLAAEEVTLHDLKARILQRAYLSRHARPLLLTPARLDLGDPEPDEFFPGRRQLPVAFDLPRGSYASLVLNGAALWASDERV